jgi:hypothetical protein
MCACCSMLRALNIVWRPTPARGAVGHTRSGCDAAEEVMYLVCMYRDHGYEVSAGKSAAAPSIEMTVSSCTGDP